MFKTISVTALIFLTLSNSLFAYGLFDTSFGPTVIPIEDVPESVTQTALQQNINKINHIEVKTKLNKYDYIFFGVVIVLAAFFIHQYNSTIKINPDSSNYK